LELVNRTVELQYIEDVAGIIVTYTISDFHVAQTYEVMSGPSISINDLARKVISLTNSTSLLRHLPIRIGEGADELSARSPDIRTLIPGASYTDLHRGLIETIAWYKDNDELV
jgi:nucleoside-diphosphate-sugar epimerase